MTGAFVIQRENRAFAILCHSATSGSDCHSLSFLAILLFPLSSLFLSGWGGSSEIFCTFGKEISTNYGKGKYHSAGTQYREVSAGMR